MLTIQTAPQEHLSDTQSIRVLVTEDEELIVTNDSAFAYCQYPYRPSAGIYTKHVLGMIAIL